MGGKRKRRENTAKTEDQSDVLKVVAPFNKISHIVGNIGRAYVNPNEKHGEMAP